MFGKAMMDRFPNRNLSADFGGNGRHRTQGFSLVELLVVLGIITLLGTLLLTVASHVRMASQSTRCMANLHNIAVAFTNYANDNDGRYPTPVAVDRSWESLLQPYLSQKDTFACPADDEMYPSVGSSYDWRDTPDPYTTLAGRPMASVTRPDAVLAFETLPGWHGKHLMNAVRVNGSEAAMIDDQCLLDLQSAVCSTQINGPTTSGINGP